MSNLAIIVDEQDNVIGEKNRYEIGKGDIIRISSLWLENSKGQVLLAKRSMQKKHDPGLWGTSAAGTLEPNETYDSNISKEVEEELGITGLELEPYKHWMFRRDDGTGRFAMVYRAVIDKPANVFIIQKDEVDEVKWFDKTNIKLQLKSHPEKFVGSAQVWEDLGLL